MGRPLQEGMLYFGHDTDMSHDPKIEAIEALYGILGYAYFLKLLERVYRDANTQLEVKTDTQIKVLSASLQLKPEEFTTYCLDCCEIGLFDKKQYENDHVLTSNGIKKRRDLVDKKRETARKWNEEHRGKSDTDDEQELETNSRKSYGEFKNVLLSDEEYQKLVDKFGESGCKDKIEILSTAIQSKGYQYKSHYATILVWDKKTSNKDECDVRNRYHRVNPTNDPDKYHKGKYGHMVVGNEKSEE